MADCKPPKSVDDERATLHILLQYHRDSIVRKVMGIDDATARTSPVPSGTTLLWLIKHLAMAESLWILYRFAGQDESALVDDIVAADDTMDEAVETYRATWAKVDAVIAAEPSLDAPCRNLVDDAPANLRWVVMHLLEETARHAGHADIIRELIDGHTGR